MTTQELTNLDCERILCLNPIVSGHFQYLEVQLLVPSSCRLTGQVQPKLHNVSGGLPPNHATLHQGSNGRVYRAGQGKAWYYMNGLQRQLYQQ
jgi:hypothetical protein